MSQTQTPAKKVIEGSVIPYTGVSTLYAGDVVLLGTIPLIAVPTDPNLPVGQQQLATEGVYDVPKTSDSFTAGDAVYWDADGDPVSGTAGTGAADASAATGNLMGVAILDAASGDSYVRVKLTAAKRTATIAGSVTADDITGSDSTLAIVGLFSASANTVGGLVSLTGAAGNGTGAGGAASLAGGASGSGATGNGGAASVAGGAAASTNGTGGAASVAGGVATGTGVGGAVTVTSGASAGASGTAGNVSINTGAANGGTGGSINIASSAGTVRIGPSTAETAPIKGFYLSGNVAVAVPDIADAESDEVAVDVASAFTIQPAVGDVVIAIPAEALPTSCQLNGAYVSATDTVTISFGTKEGGSGVTGANKNFKFLIIDLT